MEKTIAITLSPGAQPPTYMTVGSAGADLYACLAEPITIPSGKYAAVPTGVSIQLPDGYEGQIRPRSGLARKNGITILNAPGTIDSDYRGEIVVLLINHGQEDYTIEHGDRIAQLVIGSVLHAEFCIADSLSTTERNIEGFGHTGKR